MSSNVIPKEQLSAYQRWELASFGDERPSARQQNLAEAAAVKQTEEELAALREEARRQGHAEGLAKGRTEGLAAGRAAAGDETRRLREIAGSFSAALEQANGAIADDLLNLALDLAKAMLKTALAVRPELVLPLVGEAVRYLPGMQQPSLLVLNPADAALVRQHMADELSKGGWRVAEDAQMERGGCRVETTSNHVDASTQVRWQRIAEALGKQSDWLA